MRFRDRRHAGQLLAERFQQKEISPEALVLALPRGGIPVGLEIARKLNLPFDLWLVRKLGVPGQEELAMGALALGGIQVWNQDVLANTGVSQAQKQAVIDKESAELERRNRLYRQARPLPGIQDRDIILVDDGIATGATMRAAIAALRAQSPKKISVALPVGPPTVRDALAGADEIICLSTPMDFFSVGQAYEDFSQLTDQEVQVMLEALRQEA